MCAHCKLVLPAGWQHRQRYPAQVRQAAASSRQRLQYKAKHSYALIPGGIMHQPRPHDFGPMFFLA
jgi:hypothetical protein